MPRAMGSYATVWAVLALAACGGGASGDSGETQRTGAASVRASAAAAEVMSTRQAAQFAAQATFGPTEALIDELRSNGAAAWIAAQLPLKLSRYTFGGSDVIDKNTSPTFFCSLPENANPYCWRDYYSTQPLVWSFYRNAVHQPDQLRQRMAFALQQMLVVSGNSINSTYGLRVWHNMLLDNALGNYRAVLTQVAKSPAMGQYLNHVNNHKNGPNENFARELLQLFSIGPCRLNMDGTTTGGSCQPTYTNETVRSYAYALTGWTFPVGGATAWGCQPSGANCQYLGGEMVPVASFHDTNAHTLLAGVSVPAGTTAEQALDLVIDSVMRHPNLAPFVAKRLIQQFVTSNPSPAYVSSVAQAFASGRFATTENGQAYSFGQGQAGDLAATIAAVLLYPNARPATPSASYGKLRDPVLMTTAVLRALNGKTDGDFFMYQSGPATGEQPFLAPSVFGFYSPMNTVPGSTLLGPEFGIDNAPTSIARLNYLTWLLYWGGYRADATVPGATGTGVDLSTFQSSAADAGALVDRFSVLATGAPLPASIRARIVTAVEAFNPSTSGSWARDRLAQAAYLVFASPEFQVQP